MWDVMSKFTDDGIDPAEVGDMIVTAVQDNQFWLLPNAQVFYDLFDQELDDLKAQR
jgi:hypothetical protein